MVAPTTDDDYRGCNPAEDGTCKIHGGPILAGGARTGFYFCSTVFVLRDVRAERARQFAQYGTNSDLEYGTGEPWLPGTGESADVIQKVFRADYEQHEAVHGSPTWMHLVREEVAEAFFETDPNRLREELIQVAALAVSWIEKIDAKESDTFKRRVAP